MEVFNGEHVGPLAQGLAHLVRVRGRGRGRARGRDWARVGFGLGLGFGFGLGLGLGLGVVRAHRVGVHLGRGDIGEI